MGRGRAKAKQTKVARDLKYRQLDTDFGALARELHGGEYEDEGKEPEESSPPEVEKWADYDPSRD